MIEIGPVRVSGSQMLVRGADTRSWIGVASTGLTISEVVEHGFHVEGVARQTRVPADDVASFSVVLPFRRRAWAWTLALLGALAPAGLDYDGNVIRVYVDGIDGRCLELGRREDWIIDERLSKALEEWTEKMSSWSMTWTCSETALAAYLEAIRGRRTSRRRLRFLVAEVQSLGNPDEPPPADVGALLRRRLSPSDG